VLSFDAVRYLEVLRRSEQSLSKIKDDRVMLLFSDSCSDFRV